MSLSKSELHDRWHKYIMPEVFADSVQDPDPVLVLLGGQPGSGKTRGQDVLRRAYFDRSLVSIIGDDYRAVHPDYCKILQINPLRMPEVTADAAGAWVEMSISFGLEQRYSLIVEGTWRNSDVALKTLERAISCGYSVHAWAMGVPQEQSRIGCVARYYFDSAKGRKARWTPPEAHDQGFANCPSTFGQLVEHAATRRIAVLNQKDQVIFHQSGPELIRNSNNAESVLQAAQFRAWECDEAVSWMELLENLRPHRSVTKYEPVAEEVWERLEGVDYDRVSKMMTQ